MIEAAAVIAIKKSDAVALEAVVGVAAENQKTGSRDNPLNIFTIGDYCLWL